jgi:hypothetical protein
MEIQQKDLNFKKEIKAEPQKTPATTPDTRLSAIRVFTADNPALKRIFPTFELIRHIPFV